jgi:hypothetical protein
MQTVMVQAASDQIVPVESSPPAPPAAAAPLAKKAAKREMATLVLSGRQTAQMSGRSVAPTHWTICADPADRTHGRVCRDSGMLAADPVLIDRRVSFLSVASSGLDVWAGGAKGALFHSSDSGEHWERIAVSETISKSGRRLHGAIVKIDLSTPTRLQILTDRGETWVREGGNWLRRGD